MPKSLPFRVRKCYFDKIVLGDKNVEYRPDTRYWRVRLVPYIDPNPHEAALKALKDDLTAVFICGPRVHRRRIVLIERAETPLFSKLGMKDVPTPKCFAIHLGLLVRID